MSMPVMDYPNYFLLNSLDRSAETEMPFNLIGERLARSHRPVQRLFSICKACPRPRPELSLPFSEC
jgi:hypothetical protein